MGRQALEADIRDVGGEGAFVDAGEIEITGPKRAGEIDRPGFGDGFDDRLERHRLELDAKFVLGLLVGQQSGIIPEGGGDAPIEPRTDGDEDGSVSNTIIDGELRQHVFAPELFEGGRAQGSAVGVVVEA